jgi:hypothetical protein
MYPHLIPRAIDLEVRPKQVLDGQFQSRSISFSLVFLFRAGIKILRLPALLLTLILHNPHPLPTFNHALVFEHVRRDLCF